MCYTCYIMTIMFPERRPVEANGLDMMWHITSFLQAPASTLKRVWWNIGAGLATVPCFKQRQWDNPWHILAYLGILRPRCHFSKVEQCWRGGPAATHWELTEQDTPPMLCMFDKAGSTGVHSSDHSSPWISLGVPWFSIQPALKKSWWICVNCLDSGSTAVSNLNDQHVCKKIEPIINISTSCHILKIGRFRSCAAGILQN